jgi:hypothetical protein
MMNSIPIFSFALYPGTYQSSVYINIARMKRFEVDDYRVSRMLIKTQCGKSCKSIKLSAR